MASALMPSADRGNQGFGKFTAAAAVAGTPGDVLNFVKGHSLFGQGFEGILLQGIAYANEHGEEFTAMRIIVNTFCAFFGFDFHRTRRR